MTLRKYSIQFSDSKNVAIAQFVQEHGLSFEAILFGAWALLLQRYTGESDVLFGVQSYQDSEIDEVDKVPENQLLLPMRLQISSDCSALSWLQQVHAQWLALATSDQEQALREYNQVTLSAAEFSQSAVLWSHTHDFESSQTLLENNHSNQSQLEQASLLLLGTLAPRLKLQLCCKASRFSEDKANRILGHLETLLTGIIANPESSLVSLPLLTPAEQHQLLIEWNQTQTQYPQGQSIHQLFEAQVKQTPDAVAVVFPDCQSGNHQTFYSQPL